ncbi:MAG: hypothetical protein IJE90_04530 [Clostridia bacterium]|nr:hypothetical protein [Clostridia bacterium]
MGRYNRIARSLCAVIFALCFVSVLSVVRADNDPPVEDRFSLTVEFGSLAFYYDHGVWDPNLMNYVASSNDTSAAAGTTAGYPGWYGFDGTANAISVQNTSYDEMTINLSLSYSALNDVTGVNMTVTDGGGWSGSANNYTASLSQGQEATALIQLSGTPMYGGKRYISENTMNPIGMIILKIESPLTPPTAG